LRNVVRAKTNSILTQANAHLSNPDIVNNYFAGIAAADDCCIKSEVLKFCRSHGTEDSRMSSLSDYAVETYLHKIRNTSSGCSDRPCWVFKQCSYELASIVTAVFNKSLQTGTVPTAWLTAVVTPVPKKSCPSGLADYRPMSVTPIIVLCSGKISFAALLRPAIPTDNWQTSLASVLYTSSTTCALVHFRK